MFNVVLSFHEEFIDVIKDPEQPNLSRTGAVTLAREWPIQISKIDPGVINPFVFYIYNQSNKFVEITMPEFAVSEGPDKGSRRSVRIIQQSRLLYYLGPFEL